MNRDAYRTPKEVFAVMNAEFNFKSDVCASVENALCHYYITEELNCLTQNWFTMCIDVGDYVWMNPPYSNIGPFVKRSAEMAAQGVGTVMLVMMDQSVGWYKDAIQTCQEVRLMIGGRLAFVDPSTNKPAAGNNKGSMFIIWHPFGRTKVQYSHIDRDEMLAAGRELLNQFVEANKMVEAEPTATTCDAPAEPIIAERKAIELITVKFTSEQLAEQIASGKLAFDGDHLALMLQLDGMFGKRDTYTTSQIRTAILALDEPGMVTKGGEVVTAVAQVDDTNVVELTEEQNDLFVHFDEAIGCVTTEPAAMMVTAKAEDMPLSTDPEIFFDILGIPAELRYEPKGCSQENIWHRPAHSIFMFGPWTKNKETFIAIKSTGNYKKGYWYECQLVASCKGKELGEFAHWNDAMASINAQSNNERTEPEGQAHPFFAGFYSGNATYVQTAKDKIERVKTLSYEQCLVALKLKNLGSSVTDAVNRRIKQLEREGVAA